MALAAGAPDAAAQSAAPARAVALRVALRVAPRAGDTVRMRFEQEVEMWSPGGGDGEAGASRRTTLVVLARTIVERATAAGAEVLAVTDSVEVSATGTDPRALDAARRSMQGRRARLRVTPAGASERLDRGAAAPGDDAVYARFPGTLPTEPVSVGATWTREMPLPLAGGDRKGGKVQVLFRLDSVGGGGEVAHVSMRGSLSRDGGTAPNGARVATTGTLVGSLVLDLRRGWMTDSRSTFVMTSLVTPPGGADRAPSRVKLRVTQRLRAM